jgi:protein phosphatase 1G
MDKIERTRIEAAGGSVTDVGGVYRVNGNLNLSRAIGDLKYKTNESLPPEAQIITATPDVRVFELSSMDRFFLLACDGVWDVMTNEVRSMLSLSPAMTVLVTVTVRAVVSCSVEPT